MAATVHAELLRQAREAIRQAEDIALGRPRLVTPTLIEFSAPVEEGPGIVDVMVDDLGVPPPARIRNVARAFRGGHR